MQMDTAVEERVERGVEPDSGQDAEARAGKYLIFQLGSEDFGIPVLPVREILSLRDITPVPHTPRHIRGVTNLRGKIIPVVDLRIKFKMPAAGDSIANCIVVVQANRGAETLMIGMIVDSVTEVVSLKAGDIVDAPDFGESVVTPWLLGIARKQNGVRILLKVDAVLSRSEIEGLEHVRNEEN
jgi:purine-binding chemotaxis protein CheW